MRSAPRLVKRHLVGVPAAAGLLAAVVLLSLRYGAVRIDTATVWDAIWNYDPDDHAQAVVRELRLHRSAIGVMAGASFAVAGVLIQGMTRNPLGAPAILGTNAGAAFAAVLAVHVVGIANPAGYVWFAFAGALGATGLVYAIASAGSGRASPLKLALAGAVITALLASWTSALLLLDSGSPDQAQFWLAGSLTSRDPDEAALLWPIVAAALLAALLLGPHLNALSLGDEVAAGLGLRTRTVQAVAGLVVVALAGSAVVLAGPVAFIGLAVPHIARRAAGPDYRWIIVYSLLVGPCLMLGADIIGRLVVAPQELQVGVVSAALGALFLIYLVRRTRLVEL